MAEKYRFRQNSKISKEELRDGDIIPVEHDPSGINDRDRSLEVSTLVDYITDNENNTNSLLDKLTLKEETPADSDCIIVQESGAEETLKASTRRPISFIWEYIKNKISTVLGLTSETYNGKAATATDADHATNADDANHATDADSATNATNDASGNNIINTYVNNDTLAQALEPFSGAGTGNGTASINIEDATQIDVSLDNFPTLINPVVGFKFRVVFAADYATDSQPNIKMNGGTAYPVTVGNVPAGIGAFQQDKSYEFIFTGTSYDCLSKAYSDAYSETEINTGKKWIDGKWIYRKVVTGTFPNNYLLLTGISTLIRTFGYSSYSQYQGLFPFGSSTNYNYLRVTVSDHTLRVYSNITLDNCSIVIEYTKI